MADIKTIPLVKSKQVKQVKKLKKPNLIYRIHIDLVKNKLLYFLSFPGVLYYILFCYLPMVGLIVAFKEYRMDLGLFGSKFIGFENFRFLFIDRKTILQVIFNTLFLNFMFISVGTFLAVTTSVLLNEIRSKTYKKITQSMITLPNFISWVVVAAFAYNLFGEILFNDLEQRYGGVYPVLIGTNSRHTYQSISMTSISWSSGTKTLSMGFNNPFEELDVYTGSSGLSNVKINGVTLTSGTDYTFDATTHILRITRTNTAGNNFTVTVTVQ